MNRKTVMAVPMACFWAVVAACLLGIVIGSFCDFSINAALANKTDFAALSINGIPESSEEEWIEAHSIP